MRTLLFALGVYAALTTATVASNNRTIGRVEIIPGVAAPNCDIAALETPLKANCDAHGIFDLVGLPPGRWVLRVLVPLAGTSEKLERRWPIVMPSGGSNISNADVGTFVMTRGVTVFGRVRGVTSIDHGEYFVAIPALGLAAPLSPQGTYVLTGVPPGQHAAEVRMFTPPAVHRMRKRMNANLTVGVGALFKADDFDVSAAVVTPPKQQR